jgi:hypothetical protein
MMTRVIGRMRAMSLASRTGCCLMALITTNYAYDNEGNRTRRVAIATGEITEYGWDTRNRMTSVVTKASGGSVIKAIEYTYDVYDRRIAMAVDSDGNGPAAVTQERFVYDGDHIALVFDGNMVAIRPAVTCMGRR